MVGQHNQLNAREFEQTLGGSEGQGSLACCSLWGHKDSDRTQKRTLATYIDLPQQKHLDIQKYLIEKDIIIKIIKIIQQQQNTF